MKTKKKIVIISFASLLAASAVVIGVSANALKNAGLTRLKADAKSLSLNDETTWVSNTATLNLANGQVVFHSEGNELTLGTDEKLYHEALIKGISEIEYTLASAGDVIVGYKWSGQDSADPYNYRLLSGLSGVIDFSEEKPNSFYLENHGASNIEFTSITVTYDCQAGVAPARAGDIYLDGHDYDLLFNPEAKTNNFHAQNGNGNTKIDIQAVRDSNNGVYIYADYYTKNIKNAGNGWWEKDNVEFRLVGRPYKNFQYWASANKNSNFTSARISDFTEVDGYNYMTFELYISYDKIHDDTFATIDGFNTPIIFQFGSNPVDGFFTPTSLDAYVPEVSKTIQANGINNPQYDSFEAYQNTLMPADPSSLTNLLESPVYKENLIGWTSEFSRVTLRSDEDFAVYYQFNVTTTETGWYFSWVGNVCSYDIASGEQWIRSGWTVRADWWGWDAWNRQGGDNNGQPGYVQANGNLDNIMNSIHNNMDVELLFTYDSAKELIRINGIYRGHDDPTKVARISYAATNDGYETDGLRIFVGVDHASITFNQISVISGAMIENGFSH